MKLELIFRGNETVEFPDFTEKSYDEFLDKLNGGQILFVRFEDEEGRKFSVHRDNILMTVLKED